MLITKENIKDLIALFTNPDNHKTMWMGIAHKNTYLKVVTVEEKACLVDEIHYAEGELNALAFHETKVVEFSDNIPHKHVDDLANTAVTTTYSTDRWNLHLLCEDDSLIVVSESLGGLLEDLRIMEADMLLRMENFKESFNKLARDFYNDNDLGMNLFEELLSSSKDAGKLILAIQSRFGNKEEERISSIALTALKLDRFKINTDNGHINFRISEVVSFVIAGDKEDDSEHVVLTMKNGDVFKVTKKETPNQYKTLVKILKTPSLREYTWTIMG